MKVLITRPWPKPAMPKILKAFPGLTVREVDAPMTDDQMVQALGEYDIIAPTLGDHFSAAVFNSAQDPIKTKLLANFGAGLDHIDLAAAKAAGVKVTNTPDATTQATAETAILLMLMCARLTMQAQALIYGRVDGGAWGDDGPGWTGWTPTQLMGQGLNGKTLGIVGMGQIGKEVARRAYLAFGMHILFYNRTPRQGILGVVATQVEDVDTLCQRADFISIHAASTPQTRGIIGAKQIELLGPQGTLINTARGDLIDEGAVLDALGAGGLGAAGLDVYQNEPAINPRWVHEPRACLLPHIGSGTIEARTAMALRSLGNMKAFASGDALVDQVN